MTETMKSALLGGIAGAVLAVILMTGAIALKIVPVASDSRLEAYLMAHPKLIYQMQAKAEQQDAEEAKQASLDAIKKIGIKKFLDPKVGFVTGPANAKNTIIEVYDYNCVHCRNAASVLKKFYEKHKSDTRFALIEFPIFGDASTNAARASVAAHNQPDKFMAFHFALMSDGAASSDAVLAAAQKAGLDIMKLSADLNKPETEKTLLAGFRLAREAQFRGTPMFIINGKLHDGEVTEEDLKTLEKK